MGATWSVVQKFLVHVVGDGEEFAGLDHFGNPTKFVFGVGRPGRIGRAVEEQHLAVRAEGFVELICRNFEAGFFGCGQEFRRPAGQNHDIGIADPIGRGDEDFISGADQGMKGIEEDMFPTTPGRDFRESVFEAVISPELGNNGLFDVRSAAHRRIFGLALFEGRNRRVFDMLRGIEVGLASPKINDLNPLATERRDFHRDHEGRRWFDLLQTW